MDRSWMRRAVSWTLVLGGVLVQGWLLIRFSSAAMRAFIVDESRYDGRWWHQNEPLFAVAGFALLSLGTLLLVLAWTKALRTPSQVDPKPGPGDDDAGADGEAAGIDLPAFLRPKMRRVRPGTGMLLGMTALSLLMLLAGVGLGIFESFQLYEVLVNNRGNPAALQSNSTVWILRLLHWIAPAIASLGAVLFGFTWGRFWPLPPAKMVVVGETPKAPAARTGTEWKNFD